MTWLLLLAWLISRPYHLETVASLPTSHWTSVEVCGLVTLTKWEDDGDRHIRISDGRSFIVAEIVPYHPITPMPRKGHYVCVDGISRYDREHGWWEVHPVERWHTL